ncbi:MAG TPA: nuclear transport factor 2 family protein [Candidatus Acidoferrales bacterium]|nr:nuclear transport factor 2 family protein [Candidatus Acidoferrales bacterium]
MAHTRKILLTTILTILAVRVIWLDGTAAHGGAARGDAAVQRELTAVDKQWLHAATVQDVAYLKGLFAPGMFEVQRGGVVETGEEMRKVIGAPGRHILVDIDDVVVRGIYGDTAIITDQTTQMGTAPDGRQISGEYTVMRILQKQEGKWRALGAQMTPLKPSIMATPMTHDTPDTVAKNATEKELIGIDHKWVDAATNGDTAYLKELFTDHMFEVGGDGRASGAEALLKGIGARKPGQFQGFCDQIQIRGIYGDTAVLTDRRVLKGTGTNGQAIDAAWRVTRVLVKQNGKWRAAASALTAIPQS